MQPRHKFYPIDIWYSKCSHFPRRSIIVKHWGILPQNILMYLSNNSENWSVSRWYRLVTPIDVKIFERTARFRYILRSVGISLVFFNFYSCLAVCKFKDFPSRLKNQIIIAFLSKGYVNICFIFFRGFFTYSVYIGTSQI